MTDPLPPLDDPDHPDLWVIRYLDGTLSEAERSAFEAHMKSHAECREHVETMRAALPAVVRVLSEKAPLQTGKDFLAGAEARRKAKLESRPSTSLGANERSPHPALCPRRGEGGGHRWWWIWGGGFAGLAAAAASVLVVLQPFTAGLEPELLKAAVVDLAPWQDAGVQPPRPVPPSPAKLELSATVRFGRLELASARLPTEVYTAVVLIDSQKQLWVVQPADRRDPTCTPSCGDLKLRVELDRLAPGAFQVAVLASTYPIFKGDLEDFWKDPTAAKAGRMSLPGYGSVVVTR